MEILERKPLTFYHTFSTIDLCEGGDKMSPRTGRPKAENPKDIRFSICLDSFTNDRLSAYCKEQGVRKSEAIRQGIMLLLRKKK